MRSNVDLPHPEVLDDIAFAVDRQELVSVVGASGCGKSTLLRILGGLLQPTAGSVRINGDTVTSPRPDTVALVFQEDALLPWQKVDDNVALGLAARKVPKRERAEKVAAALSVVRLAGFAKAHPHQLSGGMRQRAALARALVLEPQVLLLDEPFASLDEQTRNLMGQELRNLHQRIGGAMVMVTHSLTEAVLLSDRVVALSSRPGRVRSILPIDLPEDRSVDLVNTTEFTDLRQELWQLLKDEWLSSQEAVGAGAG
jgi:NitT/TauT family transport system ATP-binding protein